MKPRVTRFPRWHSCENRDVNDGQEESRLNFTCTNRLLVAVTMNTDMRGALMRALHTSTLFSPHIILMVLMRKFSFIYSASGWHTL